MIRSLTTLANGLHGACLLALGRAEGLRYVEWDLRGAARSFWAAALCLPGLLCLRLMDWAASGAPTHPGEWLLRDLLAYTIGWAGYAVLSQFVAGKIGRERHWPRFIAAWNWCNVAQYGLLMLGTLPGALGAPWIVGSNRGSCRGGLGAVA